jgi:hypothetical protein
LKYSVDTLDQLSITHSKNKDVRMLLENSGLLSTD